MQICKERICQTAQKKICMCSLRILERRSQNKIRKGVWGREYTPKFDNCCVELLRFLVDKMYFAYFASYIVEWHCCLMNLLECPQIVRNYQNCQKLSKMVEFVKIKIVKKNC